MPTLDDSKLRFMRTLGQGFLARQMAIDQTKIAQQKKRMYDETINRINENYTSALTQRREPVVDRPQGFVGPGMPVQPGMEAFGERTVQPSNEEIYGASVRAKSALVPLGEYGKQATENIDQDITNRSRLFRTDQSRTAYEDFSGGYPQTPEGRSTAARDFTELQTRQAITKSQESKPIAIGPERTVDFGDGRGKVLVRPMGFGPDKFTGWEEVKGSGGGGGMGTSSPRFRVLEQEKNAAQRELQSIPSKEKAEVYLGMKAAPIMPGTERRDRFDRIVPGSGTPDPRWRKWLSAIEKVETFLEASGEPYTPFQVQAKQALGQEPSEEDWKGQKATVVSSSLQPGAKSEKIPGGETKKSVSLKAARQQYGDAAKEYSDEDLRNFLTQNGFVVTD